MSVPAKDADELVRKWRDLWLPAIQQDINRAMLHRTMWKSLLREFNSAREGHNSLFWGSYTALYAQAQGATLRRIIGKRGRKNEVTLIGLIEAVLRNREIVTWDRIKQLAEEAGTDVSSWDALSYRWSDSVDEDTAQELYDQSESIQKWVDTKVAHRDIATIDPDEERRAPTYLEMHDLLDRVGEVQNEIQVMLTNGITAYPPIIAEDWTAVFGDLYANGPQPDDF